MSRRLDRCFGRDNQLRIDKKLDFFLFIVRAFEKRFGVLVVLDDLWNVTGFRFWSRLDRGFDMLRLKRRPRRGLYGDRSERVPWAGYRRVGRRWLRCADNMRPILVHGGWFDRDLQGVVAKILIGNQGRDLLFEHFSDQHLNEVVVGLQPAVDKHLKPLITDYLDLKSFDK